MFELRPPALVTCMRALAYAMLGCGVAAWLFGLWLGPQAAAIRLTGAQLFLDYHVYRDQLLRFGTTGHTVSTRWYYPPFAAVLLWPLRAPEPAALCGYYLAQAALLALLCRECFKLLHRMPRWPRLAAAVGLTFACYPVTCCLALGQVGLLITVLTLRSLSGRGRSLAWLGAAIAFKVYPVLFALGYVVRLELRALLRLGGWLVLLGIALPVLWLGPVAFWHLLEVSLDVALRRRGPRFDIDQTLEAVVGRLFYTRSLFDSEPHGLLLSWPLPVVLALSLMAPALALAYALWRTRWLPMNDPLVIAAVLVAVTLLIKPGWPHYWVVLPYAQAALLSRAERGRDLGLCALSFTCSALPLLSLLIPGALQPLHAWGVLTLAGLCALLGVCELAARTEAAHEHSVQTHRGAAQPG